MTQEELHCNRVRSFRDLAASELGATKLLSLSLRGQSAYFLQQSVEKLARGLLEIEDVKVGPTHNIMQLAQMLSAHPEFASRLKELDGLSPAATRYSYPGPGGEIRAIGEAQLAEWGAAVERLNEDVGAVLMAYVNEAKAR